jgi:hypothetical protein
MYLLLGGLCGPMFGAIVAIFPLPVLGIILLFESLALMKLIADLAGDADSLFVALATGVAALALPNGFLIGILGGAALHHSLRYLRR